MLRMKMIDQINREVRDLGTDNMTLTNDLRLRLWVNSGQIIFKYVFFKIIPVLTLIKIWYLYGELSFSVTLQ